MATTGPDGQHIIAAGEVGAYTVCPMSWKLKWVDQEKARQVASASLGQVLHQDWSTVFEESLLLTKWVRYLVVMLMTALLVFLLIHPPRVPLSGIFSVSLRSHGLQLIVLIAVTLLVIRSFGKAARKRHRETGFAMSQVAVAMEGSSIVPAREYISVAQGLAGKPDALVREGADILPVERKPLAKKIRDRYVAQLLVYMRLVEEFEGRRPPRGYLLLGENCKRVVVENTVAKQAWVDRLLEQMREILNGGEAKATPHPVKCAKCDVRHRCSARRDAPTQQETSR